jgi:hypothetical protein
LTIAVVSGWLLTVANTGDSNAVIDTGDEVQEITYSHRIQVTDRYISKLLTKVAAGLWRHFCSGSSSSSSCACTGTGRTAAAAIAAAASRIASGLCLLGQAMVVKRYWQTAGGGAAAAAGLLWHACKRMLLLLLLQQTEIDPIKRLYPSCPCFYNLVMHIVL